MSKLKACPFCGKKNVLLYHQAAGKWYVECNCQIEQSTEEKAIKAWNTRSVDVAEIEAVIRNYMTENQCCIGDEHIKTIAEKLGGRL